MRTHAGVIAAAWTPAFLSPSLWYKADTGLFQDTAGSLPVTTNAQSVKRWEDQSGNGVHLLESGFGAQYIPTYRTNQVNGFPTIRFTGQKLMADAVGPFNAQSVSAFVVYKRRAHTSYPILNFRGTAGAFNATDFFLNDGFSRPHVGSTGVETHSDIGFPLSTFVVVHCITTASTFQYGINDRLSRVIASTPSSTNRQGFEIGYSIASCDLDVAEVIYVPRTVTSGERDACQNYLMRKYGLSTPAKVNNLVFVGNSITVGHTAQYQPWSDKAAVSAGVSVFDCNNRAVSGATTSSLASAYAANVAPLFDSSVANNLLVFWEGTNHIAGNVSAATAQTAIRDYCLAARADGWKVVTGTVIDRTSLFSGGQSTSGFRATAASVNSWLAANYASFADALADPAANAHLQDASSSTYFTDGTHLTQAGHDDVAAAFTTAITAALAA